MSLQDERLFFRIEDECIENACAFQYHKKVIVYSEEKVKKAIKELKQELKKENSTNPDVNAIISRGQVLDIIEKVFGNKLCEVEDGE